MAVRFSSSGASLSTKAISDALSNNSFITSELDDLPPIEDVGIGIDSHQLEDKTEYTYLGTVNMFSPLFIESTSDVAISGSGLAEIRWINGSLTTPLFYIKDNTNVTIKNVHIVAQTLDRGVVFDGLGTNSTLTLNNVTISGFLDLGTLTSYSSIIISECKIKNVSGDFIIDSAMDVKFNDNITTNLAKPLHIKDCTHTAITTNTFNKSSSPGNLCSILLTGVLGDFVLSGNNSQPPINDCFLEIGTLAVFDLVTVNGNPVNIDNSGSSFFKQGLSGNITSFSDNLSGGTTVTSVGHTLINGDTLRVESTPLDYIGVGGYTIFNVIVGVSFDISILFVTDGIGQWKTEIDETTPGISVFINEGVSNSSNTIDTGQTSNLLPTAVLNGIPTPIIADYTQRGTPKRFVSNGDGIITYIGERDVDVRFRINVTANTPVGKNLYKVSVALDNTTDPFTPLDDFAQSIFIEKDALNNVTSEGTVSLKPGWSLQSFVEAIGHNRSFEAIDILFSVFGVL